MYKRVVIGANMKPCVRVIALSTKGLVSGLVEWTIQVEMNLSPGSTSRTTSAPTALIAQLSEATT